MPEAQDGAPPAPAAAAPTAATTATLSQRPPLPQSRSRRVATRTGDSDAAAAADATGARVAAATPTGLTKSQAITAFATCIHDEMVALVDAFACTTEDDAAIAFASFKRQWRERRLSAAFHVEFWDSTPSDVHRVILQQALDVFVACVAVVHSAEASVLEEEESDLVRCIAATFTLYCAYSVQLSRPRHKITVDPSRWAAVVEWTARSSTLVAHATLGAAVREGRAMLRRLVDDDAFLRCLGTAFSEYRCPSATAAASFQASSQATETTGSSTIPLISRRQDDGKKLEMVQRLEALSLQYSRTMASLRAIGTAASAAATTRSGRAADSAGGSSASFLRRVQGRSDGGAGLMPSTAAASSSLGSFAGTVWTVDRAQRAEMWTTTLRETLFPPAPASRPNIMDLADAMSAASSDVGLTLFAGDDTALSTTSDVDAALQALENELESSRSLVSERRRRRVNQ
ncbi:hypothetical protein PINS_up007236 [Pythium insidiosum]|nr:hypothetical protein PINS_up007236 [Pythium insidiosum]